MRMEEADKGFLHFAFQLNARTPQHSRMFLMQISLMGVVDLFSANLASVRDHGAARRSGTCTNHHEEVTQQIYQCAPYVSSWLLPGK